MLLAPVSLIPLQERSVEAVRELSFEKVLTREYTCAVWVKSYDPGIQK